MAPIPVWSGNLRLSLVLVPVRMFPATSTEGTIAFRMIHEPSGKPIKYLKGIEADHGFEEVPEEEIIKGYEHTKGHHVLIKPEEIDELKLEAKHSSQPISLHRQRASSSLAPRSRCASRHQKCGTSQAGSTISESPKGWVELRPALKVQSLALHASPAAVGGTPRPERPMPHRKRERLEQAAPQGMRASWRRC